MFLLFSLVLLGSVRVSPMVVAWLVNHSKTNMEQLRVSLMHQAAQLRLRGAARLLLLDAQAAYHGGREAQVNGQELVSIFMPK